MNKEICELSIDIQQLEWANVDAEQMLLRIKQFVVFIYQISFQKHFIKALAVMSKFDI